MIGLLLGELCIVQEHQLCDEVHVSAERFAINDLFSCKFVVSVLLCYRITLNNLYLCMLLFRASSNNLSYRVLF